MNDILQYFRETQQLTRIATEDQKYYEDKTQDLLHELELVKHSYHEQAKIAREMADIRKKRRDAKELIELLTPLIEWQTANATAVKSLERTLGEMRKIFVKQENRQYYYRADNHGDVIGGKCEKAV